MSLQLRELIDAEGERASLIVRTSDMGTTRARAFHDWLLAGRRARLGPDYRVEVVGQWWLAQEGISHILDDLFYSLLTSGLAILPLMWLLLRNGPLFLASLLPNILPVLAALCFMALAGISLRIGTAMILAGSLGIAFDDSIHFMMRLKREARGAGVAAARRRVDHRPHRQGRGADDTGAARRLPQHVLQRAARHPRHGHRVDGGVHGGVPRRPVPGAGRVSAAEPQQLISGHRIVSSMSEATRSLNSPAIG